MKKLDILVPDVSTMPDPRSPDHAPRLVDWLAGGYTASWNRLMEASYSAAYAALHGTSVAYVAWQRIQERQAPPGEREFLATMNYVSAAFGASLGAIVLVAFTVESFLRLGYLVAYEIERPRGERRRGVDPALSDALGRFDAASTKKRISILREIAKLKFDRGAELAMRRLMSYRNEIAHDSPILHIASGQTTKVYERRPRDFAPYESLRDSNRPARLTHVMAAISAHDRFVENALRTSALKGWRENMMSFGGTWTAISEFMPGSDWWEQMQAYATAWEEGPERDRASNSDFHDFGLSLKRRSKVKLVPE